MATDLDLVFDDGRDEYQRYCERKGYVLGTPPSEEGVYTNPYGRLTIAHMVWEQGYRYSFSMAMYDLLTKTPMGGAHA